MINSIVLDSSILVEYTKQTKTELLDFLVGNSRFSLYINSAVLSEVTFHWLALHGGKAPRTLQQNIVIGDIVAINSPLGFLEQFTVLPSSNAIIPIYLLLMRQYNLLPNDALILATAKLHGIESVASYDPDFGPACVGEGLRWVQSPADVA